MKRVVAIDGPSGAGKSTIAKRVAEIFEFTYLDTGALYRATALGLSRAGLHEDSPDNRIAEVLKSMDVKYIDGRAWLDGEDVEEHIRDTKTGHLSSVFSAHGPVRAFLLPVQKDAAERDNLVAEGRDMTTVVFPGAWIKVFLDADVESRATRRHHQLKESGNEVDMKKAMRDVAERDDRDSSRDIAPLKRSPDALYIDSSDMDIDDVVKAIVAASKEAA